MGWSMISISKKTVGILAFIFVSTLLVQAQNADDWPSTGYLRNDYRATNVVLRVKVERAEIVGRVGGYENWRLTGHVVETFKGDIRAGDVLQFYHGAEAGFRDQLFLGDKIVFLLSENDKATGSRQFNVLENSTLAYSPRLVQKLRSISRAGMRR